ncbi:hypothetical protein M408DRAFT_75992 [Serendipita vermifera MAFF 305830]|uniref:Uncharacterized protein n=1 Tax=Serendipita vermifera MAFF 305830 TaxID=933852 RepID=A0A0C3AWT7_SERVB|nr:hypothetical protein M408DRAFT_75992 [Serendipita vermifera MAFF 305830]
MLKLGFSKPGAAPCAAFVSHCVLGLDNAGYGSLLAEGVYSGVKMYAHLVTMSTPQTDFLIRTLVKLPCELVGDGDDLDLNEIRDLIEKNFYEDDEDNSIGQYSDRHQQLVTMMGSDLAINTFAVNFRVNGELNRDIIEANDLNTRIFDRCSIVDRHTDINTRPVILTSTSLSQKSYQKCLTHFKERLGLVGDQDLYALINVGTSAFPLMANFTRIIAQDLRNIIEEEVEVSQPRNTITPTYHGFIMQGTDSVYLTYLPMFNMANHRYQLIITGDLPEDVMGKYVAGRRADPGHYFTLSNAKAAILEDMVSAGEFEAVIDIGMPPSNGCVYSSRLLFVCLIMGCIVKISLHYWLQIDEHTHC